jgi:hypothetical protein
LEGIYEHKTTHLSLMAQEVLVGERTWGRTEPEMRVGQARHLSLGHLCSASFSSMLPKKDLDSTVAWLLISFQLVL